MAGANGLTLDLDHLSAPIAAAAPRFPDMRPPPKKRTAARFPILAMVAVNYRPLTQSATERHSRRSRPKGKGLVRT